MVEKIEFILVNKLESAQKKNGFEMESSVKEVISQSDKDDTLAIKVVVNSPVRIVSAVNISKHPSDLFELNK